MRAYAIIASIILASMVIYGFSGMVSDLNTTYNTTTDTSELQSMQKLNNSYTSSIGFAGNAQNSENGLAQTGITASGTLWNSFKLLFNSITDAKDMITNAGRVLHIPNWITYSFIALVVLALALAIMTLLSTVNVVKP